SPNQRSAKTSMFRTTVPPVSGLAPPRTLLIWPKVLTVETVLTNLEFQYRQFAADASVLVYTAGCNFEAVLDVRVTAQDLRKEA
ncbi:MAG: hypothetical protein QNJ97_27785, partial [Myxococcota bacterium]|nr:hypothetical protein [Myxococcota bacterium]